MLQNPLFQDLG